MQIDFFCVGNRANAIAYIESLPEDEAVDAIHVIDHLAQGHFSELGVKKWHQKIYEVYFKRHNRLFFTIEHNHIYILYACRKHKQKTAKQDKSNILRIFKIFKKTVG